MSVRIASCNCGQLHAEVHAEPTRVSICHCHECQRRTGSVYGVQATFLREAVDIEGNGKEFVRVGDAGGEGHFTFCPECGSTHFYFAAGSEDEIGIAVGAFADSEFPAPTYSLYENRQHHWVELPDYVEQR